MFGDNLLRSWAIHTKYSQREYIDPFYSGFIVSIIISKVSERRLESKPLACWVVKRFEVAGEEKHEK